MFLVVDNYDSFTYNLVQQIGKMGYEIMVEKNDQVNVKEIEEMINSGRIRGLVISPGPRRPEYAGYSVMLVKKFSGKVPILGICLGHQCIGYAFGASIRRAEVLMHGKSSEIYFEESGIFCGLSSPFEGMRYHSLLIKPGSLPEELRITAESEDNEIMAVEHREEPIYGFQFHPESVLTRCGDQLIENFVSICRKWGQ